MMQDEQDAKPETKEDDASSQETVAQRESKWQREHGIADASSQAVEDKTGAEVDAEAGEPSA